MSTLTIACPVDMIGDANHLATALGHSVADGQTYGENMRQDTDGNVYAVTSFDSRIFARDPQGDLQRPAWDTEGLIDMTAAARAQAALVIWDREGPIPQAAPGQITVVGGMPGPEALAAMGLSAVETPDD